MQLNLGAKIRELRHRDGRTQEMLADALGVTSQAVSRWELGQAVPTIDNMIELSRLFAVSFEEFWQFSTEERMQVLSSIKRKGDTIDVALYDRLSTAERAFMRNNLNFVKRNGKGFT